MGFVSKCAKVMQFTIIYTEFFVSNNLSFDSNRHDQWLWNCEVMMELDDGLVEARYRRMMTSPNGNIFWRYWPFVRGNHRSPVDSHHNGQWCGALMFYLICAWTLGWSNNRDAGDVRPHCAHYVTNATNVTDFDVKLWYCFIKNPFHGMFRHRYWR